VSAVRWVIVGVVGAAIVGGLVFAHLAGREELAREAESDKPIKPPSRVSRGPAGEAIVTLDAPSQARLGLGTAPLVSGTAEPEVLAYGRLEEDPARVFVLRAPFAGTLAAGNATAGSGRAWPSVGETVAAGEVVGLLVPRVAPLERLDMASRLESSRADTRAFEASLDASRSASDRAKALKKEGNFVSEQNVIDAEARVRSDEARLAAARATLKLLEDAVAGRDAVRPSPLSVELSGEVVECSARPGEAVDAAQTILKVARWDRLIARVDVATGVEGRADLRGARIEVVGHEGRWLAAERVALGPVETKTGGSSWLFRVAEDGFPLRPGLPVVARLAAPGERVSGVVIPRAAVVRTAGRAWA
jgi:hypothetical protein